MIRPAQSRGKTIFLWCFCIAVLAPGAYGFIEKFLQFVRAVRADEGGGGFALVPLANYLIATLGFLCLLVWAIAQGMFRDIEKPKYDMLTHEAKLDGLPAPDFDDAESGSEIG